MRSVVAVTAASLAALALLLTACSPNAQQAPEARRFQAEDARAALIGMVEQSDDDALRYGLPMLKTDEATADGSARVEIGKWRIDLAERRFVLSLVSERARLL